MKKALVLFFLSFLFVQVRSQDHNPYQVSWNKVDTLEKQGLYRSAWHEVSNIFSKASASHDDQQQLKALIYELKYRSKIETGSDPVNIRELDSLTQTSSGIQKAILQSMLAEAYGQYVNGNRYRLYGRISSQGENENDITTWSLQHFYARMTALYEASVKPREAVGKINLKTLQVIVDTGNSLRLQPTLYDLLARRALAFYAAEETGVVHPADQFVIRSPEALSDAKTFVQTRFPATDTGSLVLKGLQLYQALIGFHLGDTDPAALRDADLARLQFVYQKAALPGKDSLYRGALERIIAASEDPSLTAGASYLLASWYDNKGSAYHPITHPEGRYDLKKALEICETIPSKPVNEPSVSARNLKAGILRPDLSLAAEQVNLPGQPFRVLVRYKNITQLFLRLVKLPASPKVVSEDQPLKADVLLHQPVLRQWEETLPNPGDYQQHALEIAVKALPPGRYALIASGDKHFSTGKYPIVDLLLYTSAISYVSNGRGDFMVLDRASGKPLEGARVHLWKTVYNATTRRNGLKSAGQFVTDAEGHFRTDTLKEATSLLPEISWGKDHLYTGQAQFIPLVRSNTTEEDSMTKKTLLFTDRAIYRPGQTLYFKGIVLEANTHTHSSHVLADQNTTVYLVDANGQRADSLSLTSNGFGSWAGSFVLNKGQLNGAMRLETKNGKGSVSFSVEDYKRPTFFVKWDTTAHPYRLGDTIPVTGTVRAYSQATIGGATVSYEVTRRTRIAIPYYRGWTPYPSPVATISQGKISTDEQGNFRFTFAATPDETIDSTSLPVFVYSVSITVTDINGESHAFDEQIPLGYRSMELTLNVPEKTGIHALDSVALSSQDLSGHFIPTAARLQLIPLEAPARFIRTRYWEQPDLHLLSKEAYLKSFPHDAYANESDPASWNEKTSLWSGEVTTNAAGSVPVSAGKIPAGWYLLQAIARDPEGLLDTAKAYIQLYDTTGKVSPFTDPLWISTEDLTANPGENLHWSVSSGEGAYVIRQDENTEASGAIQTTTLSKNIRNITMPVHASDRGGILIHYITIRYNRIFTRDVRVKVPWKDKRLHIQYETFRDKLLPGTHEQWRVRISGPDGESVSAEMLASMYDASLDAFKPHEWSDPSLYPTIGGNINWTGDPGFRQMISGTLIYPKSPTLPDYIRVDPSINWFGYTPIRPPIMYFRGNASGLSMPMRKNAEAVDLAEAPAPQAAQDTTGNHTPTNEQGGNPIRTNFNETAFFLPQLLTDDSSRITFSFTMPEALTRWKMMLFAHTRDLAYAYSKKEVVTQKELMIQANAPRFVRQGDQLTFGAKINNLTGDVLHGQAQLELYDLASGKVLDDLFGNTRQQQSFQVNAGQATLVSWKLTIPQTYTGALGYKVIANTGDLSDGEQNAIPVLSNSTLVTESLPLHYKGNGTHRFTWDVLTGIKKSSTLIPQALTVEYAANPVWYAVMALPFMDEALEGNQSANALFSRYYANALSSLVAGNIPDFQTTMQQWIQTDSSALKSPLEQNESLKTVLLQETPWVAAAQSESAQRAKVAAWYTDGASGLRLSESIEKLKALQLSNGGFTWFKGMPDDRFITTEIMTGIGHLHRLGAWPASDTANLKNIAIRGVSYLDDRMQEDYRKQLQAKASEKPVLDMADIRYLYMRSLFPEAGMEDSVKTAYRYYLDLATRQWTSQTPYYEAMLALVLNRSGDHTTASAILKSLKERAMIDPVKGMHWKESVSYRPWDAAPGETQALCIEAFQEVAHDTATVSELCTWLLTQKQTHLWPNGNSTANAVFALLVAGKNWIATSPEVSVTMGGKALLDTQQSAGAGYHTVTIPGSGINAAMGKISVAVKNAATDQPTWGAFYFQYLEQMNKVGDKEAPLSVTRQVSLEESSPNGPQLVTVNDARQLKVGDKVQVRMTVKIDQDLDYVHLKDVRASCMEPLQVLSGYHWENGSSYYETITDAAVHFYFAHLAKGTYVFTYPVYITQPGDFTGGMSTLECLYAPQFSAHSSGVELKVDEMK